MSELKASLYIGTGGCSNLKFHALTPEGYGGCTRNELPEGCPIPAVNVPEHLKCRKPGCRKLFEANKK